MKVRSRKRTRDLYHRLKGFLWSLRRKLNRGGKYELKLVRSSKKFTLRIYRQLVRVKRYLDDDRKIESYSRRDFGND